MKPSNDDNLSWRFILGLALVALFWMMIAILLSSDVEAQSGRWYEIRPSVLGYDFECVAEYPYLETHAMQWDSTNGFSELKRTPLFLGWVVPVSSCEIDAIYQDRDTGHLFRFGFTERNTDGHADHRHVTRGGWWIVPAS